ncbi:MAG: hypothetical protein PPP56_05555 [Longimonas sp.]|uniref:magnesium transporter MgtE N-terminal domain-containing protein n=1 Tax=Longimonas sp. TaxID=2039626 RepID=UPI0033473E3B
MTTPIPTPRRDDTPVRDVLKRVNHEAFPASVKDFAASLSSTNAWRFMRYADVETAAAVFPHFHPNTQRVLAENMYPDWLASVLAHCTPADRRHIKRHLSPHAHRLLEAARSPDRDTRRPSVPKRVA